MKNVLLLFLLVVGVASHGMGKNVRLHGSLKEFGANVVSMVLMVLQVNYLRSGVKKSR